MFFIDPGNDPNPKNAVVLETKFSSEISNPTHVCLAQSVRHYSKAQEVLGSIPTGSNFLLNLFCSSLCKVLLTMVPTLCYLGRPRMVETSWNSHMSRNYDTAKIALLSPVSIKLKSDWNIAFVSNNP